MDTIVIQWYVTKWPGILKFSPVLVDVVFKVSDFIRKVSKVLHGVEITVIKLACLEDWTITGIYPSPNVPVRHLCEAITEVLNNILPNRTTISLLET